METLNRLPFKARKAVFEKLEQIVDIAALSKEDREKYDESIKVYRDHLATIAYAEKRGIGIGEERGIEIGEKRGLKKGIEIGEKNTRIEIARELKKQGLSTNAIILATKLTAEEVAEL